MDQQPEESFSDETLARLLAGLAPSSSTNDPSHLAWVLENYPRLGEGGSDDPDASGAQPQGLRLADPVDPSAYQVGLPPLPGSDRSSLFDPNAQEETQPVYLIPTAAPDIRFHTAQPGDSISTILGTSDPAAIGAFMQLNGLGASQIRAGKTYQLPDPNAPRLDGATALGHAALNADNALRAAPSATRNGTDGQSLLDWQAACPVPGADFSAFPTFGLRPGSPPHAGGGSIAQSMAEFASPQAQLARVLANLQQPRDQAIINGKTYEGVHTATADGIKEPRPSWNDDLGRARAFLQTLGKLDDSTFGAIGYGGAKVMGADEPTALLALDGADALGGMGLARAGLQLDGVDRDPQWSVGRPPILPTGFSPPNSGAYVLRDPETWAVMYGGRTGNLSNRENQHLANPVFKKYLFDPIFRTDKPDERRGLEQHLYDEYGPSLNRIRPISPSNKNLNRYNAAANAFLNRGGDW